jgi:hypothetical protein
MSHDAATATLFACASGPAPGVLLISPPQLLLLLLLLHLLRLPQLLWSPLLLWPHSSCYAAAQQARLATPPAFAPPGGAGGLPCLVVDNKQPHSCFDLLWLPCCAPNSSLLFVVFSAVTCPGQHRAVLWDRLQCAVSDVASYVRSTAALRWPALCTGASGGGATSGA